MKQFLVPGSIEVGREICLREDDYHYLVHVRRVRVETVDGSRRLRSILAVVVFAVPCSP